MSGKQRRGKGRRAAEAGVSVLIRVMVLLLAIVLIILIVRTAYTAGYGLFHGEMPVAASSAAPAANAVSAAPAAGEGAS